MILAPEDDPAPDRLLRKILLTGGAYYHSGDLFFQELWKQHLVQIGFRLIMVQKLRLHHVWDLRLFGTLTSQTYLLVTKPVSPKHIAAKDLLVRQLQEEIHRIAEDLGLPIRRDCITVVRTGAYFGASFIWAKGRAGRLLKKEKPAQAFSFLIQRWLRRNRN